MAEKQKGQEKKETKKSQDKHPVECKEVIRGEVEIFDSTRYRRINLPRKGWNLESSVVIADNKCIWDIQVHSNLTQMHSLTLDAMLTAMFKEKTGVYTSTPSSAMIHTKTLVGACFVKDIRPLLPKYLAEHLTTTFKDFIEDLRRNITFEVNVYDRNTKKPIAYLNTGLIENFGFAYSSKEKYPQLTSVMLNENEKQQFLQRALQRGQEIWREYKDKRSFEPKDFDLFIFQLSPIYSLILTSSTLRFSYSTPFLQKLKDIPNGAIVSLIKYVTSQKAPFTISTVKLASKILKIDSDRNKWDRKTKEAYKNFLKFIRKFQKKLEWFNIYYDGENQLIRYPETAKGIGFITPINSNNCKVYPGLSYKQNQINEKENKNE